MTLGSTARLFANFFATGTPRAPPYESNQHFIKIKVEAARLVSFAKLFFSQRKAGVSFAEFFFSQRKAGKK
jgi:hypothetical protein